MGAKGLASRDKQIKSTTWATHKHGYFTQCITKFGLIPYYKLTMNTLFRLLTLVAIFALWGQARAYEVVIDIKVKQKSTLDKTDEGLKLKSEPALSGSAWVSTGGSERREIALPELDIKAPHTDEIDGEEWALDWLAESMPE